MKRSINMGIAAAAVGLLALAGCTADTGGNGNGDSGGGDSGASSDRDLSFAVVIHGDPDGSFWNVVKKGAEDAAADYGVEVTITGDQEGSAQATLIDSALASSPDGLVVSLANPDALSTSLQAAADADVPFISINSGAEAAADLGSLGHVGQDETIAGEGAGTEMAAAGVTNAICLIHEAGNIGLEQRCEGFANTLGGTVTNIQVDLNDPTATQSTVQSTLLGDPSIDGVLGLNPSVTATALEGVKGADSDATVAGFDLDPDVLAGIEAGDILFTVDQQQYLQGYLPIAMLVLYSENLNTVGGGLPVLTGPSFVTADNVGAVSDLIENGTR
ncbi:MAG: sugar ABC transporter substrate-binding protein [Beutenbergiaceae bacterium]